MVTACVNSFGGTASDSQLWIQGFTIASHSPIATLPPSQNNILAGTYVLDTLTKYYVFCDLSMREKDWRAWSEGDVSAEHCLQCEAGDVSAEHCLQCEAGELAGVTRAGL